MNEIDLKPIVVALVINLAMIFVLPKVFTKPTGFKAFDDFVSYLKAQQTFLGFSSVLLAIVMYATAYYIKSEGHTGEKILTEDFTTPHVPKSVSTE
jgi:hypothetical protein